MTTPIRPLPTPDLHSHSPGAAEFVPSSEIIAQRLRLGIAARLVRFRDEAKLSQAELARLTGLSRSTIAFYELGLNAQQTHNLVRIAVALGTDYHLFLPAYRDLVGEALPPPPASDDDHEQPTIHERGRERQCLKKPREKRAPAA